MNSKLNNKKLSPLEADAGSTAGMEKKDWWMFRINMCVHMYAYICVYVHTSVYVRMFGFPLCDMNRELVNARARRNIMRHRAR